MNWICPICQKENDENWICECGFDESKNYEKYPALTKVDTNFSFVSSRNVSLYKFMDVLRKIVDSRQSTKYFQVYVSTNNVAKIEHLLDVYPKMLFERIRDERGESLIFEYSLLGYAVAHGRVEIAKLLLKKGADSNDTNAMRMMIGRNEYRYCALNCAIESKKIETVELLLKYGADPNIERFIQSNYNGEWESSKINFRKIKNIDIVELLLRYGASSESIKNMGWLKSRKLKKKMETKK